MDVVVCANSSERIPLLKATIESLQAQTLQPSDILVVVDHNPALAAQLAAEIPDVVRVTESVGPRGLSGARNSGIEQSQSQIVAFIDDDATADPGWLNRLAQCYRDDDVLATGGRIVPVWDGGREPRWLPEEFLWTIGCTYRGMPEGRQIRNLIGCNMSFRSTLFEEVGGFNPDMGRLGSQPLGCEETELCIRGLKHRPDGRIVYLPDAVVYHHVPRSRQTLGYFLRRCYAEGRSKAIVRRLAGAGSLGVESRYVTRTLPPGVLRNLASAALLRDVSGGLGRAAAICLGLVATGLGFAVGAGHDMLKAPTSGGETAS